MNGVNVTSSGGMHSEEGFCAHSSDDGLLGTAKCWLEKFSPQPFLNFGRVNLSQTLVRKRTAFAPGNLFVPRVIHTITCIEQPSPLFV